MLWLIVGISICIGGAVYGAREGRTSRAFIGFLGSAMERSVIAFLGIFFLGSLLADFTRLSKQTIALDIVRMDSPYALYAAPVFVSTILLLSSLTAFLLQRRARHEDR